MLAFIQVRETNWDQLLADWEECKTTETCSISDEDVKRLLRTGRLVTGFWNGTVGFVVVNAIGSETELDSFYNYFPVADTLGYWKWGEDGKVDYVTEYTDQQDDLLFLHEDHVTYDENGNEVSSEPATFDNPNWANKYFGPGLNKFARSVDRGFDGSFG